jgi:hypothetical protein
MTATRHGERFVAGFLVTIEQPRPGRAALQTGPVKPLWTFTDSQWKRQSARTVRLPSHATNRKRQPDERQAGVPISLLKTAFPPAPYVSFRRNRTIKTNQRRETRPNLLPTSSSPAGLPPDGDCEGEVR